MERTIIRMLREASGRYGNRAYVTKKTDDGWQPWSFGEVDVISDKIAAYLIDKGFEFQAACGLLSEGRPEWVAIELGIIKAGGVSVPLSIKLTPDELAFRINHSESTAFAISSNTLANTVASLANVEKQPLLLYLDELDERLAKQIEEKGWVEGKDFITWSKMVEGGTAVLEKNPTIVSDLEKKITENETINICYTSGTTGNPKGIMLTHLNYWANSHDAVSLVTIPDSKFETLMVLPIDHSFGHTVGIYTAMLRGITIHFVDARGSNAAIIRNFPKNLPEVNPFFLLTVPSISGSFMKKISQGVAEKGKFIEGIFRRGLNAGIIRNGDGFNPAKGWTRIKTWFPYTLANLLVFPKLRKVFGDRIQFCVGGGALLEAKQQHFFAAIGVPVYQGYGLTEAAPIISSNAPARYKFGTSGMVAPTVTCKIMKDDVTEAKIGEKGEIVIKGENVMKGYFKNPEASAEVLRDGWLWTGDLGYYDEDGFLVVTGRAKALLIAKDGEKYSPEEIEEVMVNNNDIINQLLVYNDHQIFTTAMVTLQENEVKRLLKEKGITSPEDAYKAIIEDLRAYEPIAKKSISSVWIPARFAIIPKAFSEADGLVNSTVKLVRYKVIEFYKTRIDQMYESDEVNDALNLEAIKELFFA